MFNRLRITGLYQRGVSPARANTARLFELLALIAILLIAAWLRLGHPGTVEFLQDEANVSRLALDMARGQAFPLLSIDSSVGIRNPPATIYAMLPPYLLSSDPVLATGYVGLLGVVTVALLYVLVRHYYGALAALAAAFLLACNPWMAMYSRKIWDLLPPFLLLFMLTGLLGYVSSKRWAQLFHLPLLSFIGQIHYATVALLPVTLLLLFANRKRLTREFWLSIPLTVLITLPFLVGAAREGYFSAETIRRLTTPRPDQPARVVQLSGEAFRDSLLMVSGAEALYLPGQQRYPDAGLDTPPNGAVPLLIIAILCAMAVAVALLRIRENRERWVVEMSLLLWLFTTPLLFTLTWTPLYTHYLLPVIPAACALIGSLFCDVWKQHGPSRLVVALFGMSFGLTTFGNALRLDAHLAYVDVHNTPGVFSTPLRYAMPVREYLLEMKPGAVLARLEGQYVGYHSEASVWDTLLYDIPLRRFTDDSIEVYPTQPTPLLSHRCTDVTKNWLLRPDEGCLAVEMRSKADYPAAEFATIPGGFALQSGIAPVAYRWRLEPRPCLAIAWEPRGPTPEDWQVKVHFVDAQGRTVLYGDGEFWRGRYWRAGDRIVRTHCAADPPAGTLPEVLRTVVAVRIGLYIQRDGQFINSPVVDADGKLSDNQDIVIPLTGDRNVP